jgi:predicted O-methyltransferase YrrM
MDVLDFFPVNEKKKLGKLNKNDIKNVVFGFDGMINLPKKDILVENNFPWSLPIEFIVEILLPYRKKEFISIIEVGTHIGTTATRFANLIKDNENSYVLCIDTWLADVADYILRQDGLKNHLESGYNNNVFDRFIKNIQNNNLENTVIPFRLPSIQAGQILYYYGIKFDVIYIDASHEYLNVKLDLELYWNLLTDDGLLFGDDYNIEGVKKAVDEFVKNKNIELLVKENNFFNGQQQIMWIIKM